MNPAYIAVGFELLDRLLEWKQIKEAADAQGREISDGEVEAFVKGFELERQMLMDAIKRAKSEGR